MTTFGRNIIVTIIFLPLAFVAVLADGLDTPARVGIVTGVLGFLTGLWVRSGRNGDGGGPLSPLPLACLALLAFACDPQLVGFVNVVQRREEAHTLGGANTDYVRLTAQGSTPTACTSPYGCLFYSSSSNLPVLMDASGNSYAGGTAWRARQVAGTPGGVAAHDIWADTTTGALVWRSGGGNVTIGNAGGWVTVDTSQTVTGAKTFSGGISMAATTTLVAGANTLISGDKVQAAQLAIGSQATGDLLYASSGTAWTRRAAGSSGQVLSIAGGVPTWATPVYSTITGGCRGVLGATTGYLSAPGVAWSTTTEPVLLVATRNGTMRSLYCDLGIAPGGADTVTVTVRKGGVDQAITCTITGAGTTCSDTSNTFSIAAGNRIGVKGVSSAGTASDLHCTLEMGL